MKILLIDDDSFLRDMYATKFTELGYDIDVAESAEVAISKLQGSSYDVLLLDMVMPGMTGVELIKIIKSDHIGGDPLCIMLSNQSDEHDKQSALDAGAIGYIVKAELIPSEVVEAVKTLIAQAKS
ncbi:MAG TPA: response regulator [Candidatus Paceibacterota bacterium]|nr:response regulator [Candidatus Paceibacterota bacterium]